MLGLFRLRVGFCSSGIWIAETAVLDFRNYSFLGVRIEDFARMRMDIRDMTYTREGNSFLGLDLVSQLLPVIPPVMLLLKTVGDF